jgi:hypothetical protein
MTKQQYITTGIIGFALYLIATGISFAGFSTLTPKVQTLPTPVTSTALGSNGQEHFVIDPSVPRTEECPLNGEMYTKQEQAIWAKRRPLAVMIENHVEARPQSGLSYADVVYESVAEGGITRFMGVFYCGIAVRDVQFAPVRSARTYFLPWVLEYDAMYNHVGGAGICSDDTDDDRAKALCQIDTYGIKDMDQFGISYPTCYRNYDRLSHTVATEHTMMCDGDKLLALGAQRGWTNVDAQGVSWDKNFQPWQFKDDAAVADRGASFSASFVAWKGYESDYGVKWVFDRTTDSYKRFNGGVAHMDLESKQQLTAKTVVILFAKETGPVDEHGHLLYDNIGTGSGLVFEDGKVIKATWKKAIRTSRTKFYDASGKEISFNRGQIWIEMLPTGTPVTY